MARPERTLPTGVRGTPGHYYAELQHRGRRHREGPYSFVEAAARQYLFLKDYVTTYPAVRFHSPRPTRAELADEERRRQHQADHLFAKSARIDPGREYRHMDISPILGPNGQPVFTIGGDLAHAVHTYRGWVCSLEWVKQRRRYLRVLVIWPEVPNALPGTTAPGAWTITESAVAELLDVDRFGKATGTFRQPFADGQARAALIVMGRDPNDRAAVSSLLDAVMRFGPDVFVMPHAPRQVQERLTGGAMWDVHARARATGRTIHEGAV